MSLTLNNIIPKEITISTTPTPTTNGCQTKMSNSFEGFHSPASTGKATFTTCVENVENRNFQNAIDSSTIGIQEMFNNTLSLLDVRAWTYGMTMQVDKGLKDAQNMIALAPTAAAGYLRAGSIHTLRSHYKAAMQVYQTGIKALSGEQNKSARLTLQEKYNEAQEKLDIRIDFVTQLPYEVLHQVLDHIEMEEMVGLMDISKGWRDCLAGYPKPWTEICLSSQEDEEGSRPEPILFKLHHVSQHVEEIVLYSTTKEECEMLLTVIMSNIFTNLNILEIHGYQMDHHYQLLGALSNIKNTLSHLSIEVDSKSPSLPIGVVLSMCPKLETLHCEQRKAILDIQGIMPHGSMTFDSLTDLEIRFAHMEPSHLEFLLECCPKLRKLVIGHCSFAYASVVRKACPNLRSFIINYGGIMPPGNDEVVFSADPDEPKGIRYFCLFPNYRSEIMEPIIDILCDSASVLETFLMSAATPNNDITSGWNALSSVTFPKLRFINISPTRNFDPILANILSGCPVLEELLLNVGFGLGYDTFNAIAGLPSLQRLEFASIRGINYEGMTSMFRTLEARQHLLYTLEFDDCNFQLNDVALQAIAGISSLRSFTLINTQVKDQYSFDNFVLKLQQDSNNTHIRVIILCQIEAVGNNSIRSLCNIPTLQALNLYELPNVTSTGLDYVRDHDTIMLYENQY
ncbi:hypothetical protein BDA99DRAFT_499224 [Phascolomyces articulosus]|uniref:F-box domain-containing protein n=1 Tax=Phascolomyces articulosus TaxID=60185 RepID=A0AAD5K7D1_9FUNG|nr:hypothetical protein BDA99DRAFT_499224 [Phascolomyces articulosus]